MKYALLISVLTVIVGAQASLFPQDGKVRDLKSRGDLTSVLNEAGGPQLVFLYDSLDVNCHKKAPVITATGEALDTFVQVIAIDIRQPTFQWILNAWGVQVVPSVGILHGASSPTTSTNAAAASKRVASHLSRYVGGGAKHMELFPHTKPITVDALKKSALAALPDKGIERVSSVSAFDKVLTAVWGAGGSEVIPSESALVILFTDKPKTSALYKALATRYAGVVRFVEVIVKGASSPVAKHALFKGTTVATYPSLFTVFPTDDGLVAEKYPSDGALSVSAISSFVDSTSGLTLDVKKAANEKRAGLTRNAHRRRSGTTSGVALEIVNSKIDWEEYVIRNAGVTKLNGGPIRIVLSGDVKGLRASLGNVVPNVASTTPKTVLLVDASLQHALQTYFAGEQDVSGNLVVDIIPSLQGDAVVYKYGVHPASLGIEAYLEKPALKKTLKMLDWTSVPHFVTV